MCPCKRTRNRVRGGNARRAGAERQGAFATPWRVVAGSLLVVGSRIARPLAYALGTACAKLAGTAGALARENATRKVLPDSGGGSAVQCDYKSGIGTGGWEQRLQKTWTYYSAWNTWDASLGYTARSSRTHAERRSSSAPMEQR